MFREVTRAKQQLPQAECVEILKSEMRGVLRVLGDEGYPYGMPMNHWYNEADAALYFHCGNVGHRLEALREGDKVSFCCYDSGSRNEGEWAFKVKSVIVFGRIEIIDDMDRIIDITTKLSHKFTDDESYIRDEIERAAHRTLLLRLPPEHICGKLVTEA